MEVYICVKPQPGCANHILKFPAKNAKKQVLAPTSIANI